MTPLRKIESRNPSGLKRNTKKRGEKMMRDHCSHLLRLACAVLLIGATLSGCNGDSSNGNNAARQTTEVKREQDTRTFFVVDHLAGTEGTDEYSLAFDALPGATAYYGRHDGIQGESAYQIEVPDHWNGMLVMYAHGYRGEGPALTVSPPSIRPWLIENGYAWAASSYSANFYDVRAGVEDTNALALAFPYITGLNAPSKTYITGHAMGGRVAAAAVEAEAQATAQIRLSYAGSVPMCGVTADAVQFEYLTDFTFAAQHLAAEEDPNLDFPDRPATNFNADTITGLLWTTPPTRTTPGVLNEQGLKLQNLVRQLSGGERPLYEAGFNSYYYYVVMDTGGRDGTVNGILASNYGSNIGKVYQLDQDPFTLTLEEVLFNATIPRVAGDPEANQQRDDGLRWIPVINGGFNVPVVSLHGLGDLYVPFRHGQLYRQRAEDSGSDYWLVQRAIRSPGHCDFTYAEQVTAFADMLNWEQNGTKPSGDNVTDLEIISQETYGCQYTTVPIAAEASLHPARGALNSVCNQQE